MVSQVSLECEPCLAPENVGKKDADPGVPSSSQDPAAPQMPVKKQTRQWAAWTRQEEESFFAALRQVGKNFEKITCRVQSKNKDQVRHYYYRLVRRMNKLLGPELCLDAKNSKDTNAAMLRWWSLLEKYSCKASKLHLKPRRFKIFLETLENQLLKDRKKNIRKRLSTGENSTSVQQLPATHQVRTSGHDSRAVKMVLVDNQNIPKVGTGKGHLSKRPINVALDRSNCKVDPASMKSTKLRRKDGKFGLASAAAYKRWEKAAIAGVSLVADAAEHLERVDTDKEIEDVQQIPVDCTDGSQHVGEVVHSLQRSSESMHNENNVNNSTKLKLQLFPIDDSTRKALEMDHHNPHLELTLSTRKKISSVLEHLNRKWGNSSLLSQEMMLFPYWAQRENLVGYQKWTKDSPLCASDVYYLIGSPPVFRLRYGWFSKAEIESMTAQALSCNNLNEQNTNRNVETEHNAETETPRGPHNDQLVSTEQMIAMNPSSYSRVETVDCSVPVTLNSSPYHGSSAAVSSLTREIGDFAVTRQVQNAKDTAFSAGEWADSLTNISVGDLLSESAQNMDINCSELPLLVGSSCLQETPFSCDSFDAAIAAHIYKHQNKDDLQQGLPSSIWDAEETCDAFAFQKNGLFCDIDQTSSRNDNIDDACKQTTMRSPASEKDEELPEVDIITNTDHTPENSTKDIGGITDIYWPDSLGPLDLDIPSCRNPSNDLILTDSLGGLNRLIANSLDAFQSCSFFGLDKKESAPTADQARQTASFSDFKIGSEV